MCCYYRTLPSPRTHRILLCIPSSGKRYYSWRYDDCMVEGGGTSNTATLYYPNWYVDVEQDSCTVSIHRPSQNTCIVFVDSFVAGKGVIMFVLTTVRFYEGQAFIFIGLYLYCHRITFVHRAALILSSFLTSHNL